MKRLLCLLFILFALGTKAQQSLQISGTVRNSKGEPVAGATVFITNSRYITATDDEGRFNFIHIQPGNYQVIIKMIGFNTIAQIINIKQKPVIMLVQLQESITMLGTVNINGGTDPNRANYVALFIKNFIGETINALDCKLLNPEVLNFHFNPVTNILNVTADEFLTIENKALGYRIKYLLTECDIEANKSCTYKGYPYFEELKGNEKQQKKWKKNRKAAYLGSPRHFFRALANNKLDEEGYYIYLLIDTVNLRDYIKNKEVTDQKNNDGSKKIYLSKFSDTDTLFISNNEGSKIISFVHEEAGKDTLNSNIRILKEIYVVYTRQKETALVYKKIIPLNLDKLSFPKLLNSQKRYSQISRLLPLNDKIMIDKNGESNPIIGFNYSGYWGWLRMADLTPLDYVND